jgi:hypothetical protein
LKTKYSDENNFIAKEKWQIVKKNIFIVKEGTYFAGGGSILFFLL